MILFPESFINICIIGALTFSGIAALVLMGLMIKDIIQKNVW